MRLNRAGSIPSVSLSLLQFNVLVALWIASVMNMSFYQAIAHLTSYQGVAAGVFLMATGLLVFVYYFFILQLLSWRMTAKWLASILIIISAMGNYFVYELGVDINQGQILNMMQTDLHEILDLVSWRAAEFTLFTIILPLLVIWRIRIKKDAVKTVVVYKLLASIGALVVIAALAFVYYGQYAPIFREHRHLKEKLNPNNTISGLIAYSKRNFKLKDQPLVAYGTDAVLTQKTAQPRIMVLVVGETARGDSFSLNGYSKNTNPELQQLLNNHETILNFSNASSCGTETAVSLPCMFSGMTRHDYDEELAKHREGLLDLAKRAGYEVTWIENNSGCKKTCDRVGTFTLPPALKEPLCKDDACLDEVLLLSLKTYLSQLNAQPNPKNQLIVLHQMGSHGPAYYKRYPDQFKKFTPACDTNAIQNCSHEALVNSYDNTIVYTDHILASIIGQLQAQTGYQTAMWYMSDHGESTGEHGLYLHGAPYMMAPNQQTHIPMILWFSPQWQQQAPQLVPCLNQQLTLARGHDNLFPSLLSMLGVRSTAINPALDMQTLCHGKTTT
ncbi:MAG: phosphoethanolamine--lipid A transferase [Moraxellaceae bacterium]|nr:MAG: phosphoethanolamine--lipid A transferase [Moraxellaceae bacterium]